MGYLTKFGSYWGTIPQTSGNVFWVAPSANYSIEGRGSVASDGNDGMSPERAVLTVNAAIALCTDNVGDVVVLLPGTHTVTSTISVSKAGITITGLPGNQSRYSDRSNGGGVRARTTVTTSAAAGDIMTFTAAGDDVEICHLHFNLITEGDGIVIPLGADRAYIHDCTFAATGTASSTSECIHFSSSTTGTVAGAKIRNCYFTVSGNQGPAIRALGTVLGLTIESCTFELKGTAAWDDAIEVLDAGTLGVLIRDCDFMEPTSVTTVITNAIDVTGVTVDGATHVYRCFFTGDGKVGVNASATADILVAGCIVAGTTAGRTNPQSAT